MSTFSGFLDGIEHVSIDRFTQFNFRSKVFFLSHCHMDHMIGLNDVTAEMELPGPLYLSEVSQIIIQRRYPAIRNMIPLKLGEPTPIRCQDPTNESNDDTDTSLSVTAIPAGHCPGSIMLLFEQANKRILYTGDFRLYREDIEGIIALKKIHEQHHLDCLYLDSTFLSTEYMHFPKQRESIETIIKLTENWLDKNPRNIVLLRPPASYGYEFLLTELSKYFKTKIHVANSTHKDYLHIPQFDSYISNNLYQCGRIHLCSLNPLKWREKKCPCLPTLNDNHICIIRPTAMKWRKLSASDQYYEIYDDMSNVYSVCYSNHSSSDEIKFMINYLRPKVIKVNVVPSNSQARENMYSMLNAITKEYEPKTKDVDIDVEMHESTPINYDFEKITTTKKRSMSLAADEVSQLKIPKRPKLLSTK